MNNSEVDFFILRQEQTGMMRQKMEVEEIKGKTRCYCSYFGWLHDRVFIIRV